MYSQLLSGEQGYSVVRGIVSAVDHRSYTASVVLDNGQSFDNVRFLDRSIGLGGVGDFSFPTVGSSCLCLILQTGRLSDAFILGFFQDLGLQNEHALENPRIFSGDRGIVSSRDSFLMLRKSGLVEIKSTPYLHFALKPTQNTMWALFRNMELWRDPLNRLLWQESSQRKVLFELGLYADLRQIPSAQPSEPQVIFRAGATRYTPPAGESPGTKYDDFRDDSLVKLSVRSLSGDGLIEESRTVLATGRIDDGSSVRLAVEEKKNAGSVDLSIGRSDNGQLLGFVAQGGTGSGDPDHAIHYILGKDPDGVVEKKVIEDNGESLRLQSEVGRKDDGSIVSAVVDDARDGVNASLAIGSLSDGQILKISLNGTNLQVSVDGQGGYSVVNQNASVAVNADGSISVATPRATVSINAGDGNVAVSTEGQLTLNSQGDVAVNTQGNVALSAGGDLSADISGSVSVSGSGGTGLKLSNGKIGIGGREELVALLADFVEILQTGSPLGLSSMGPVELNPAIRQKLTRLRAKVNSIKGGL